MKLKRFSEDFYNKFFKSPRYYAVGTALVFFPLLTTAFFLGSPEYPLFSYVFAFFDLLPRPLWLFFAYLSGLFCLVVYVHLYKSLMGLLLLILFILFQTFFFFIGFLFSWSKEISPLPPLLLMCFAILIGVSYSLYIYYQTYRYKKPFSPMF